MVKHTSRRPVPGPGDAKRGVDGHLAYLLRQGAAAVRLRMERELADLNVTPPQFSTMTMIAAYDGISGADLARLTLLTPQTVNVILRNLERDGAVHKAPDPEHGRILRLSLTPHGQRLLAACRARVDRVEVALADTLTRREEQIVRNWLAKLAKHWLGEP